MVVAVIELVALSCHSGVSHDNIAVLVQSEMYLVSSVRALENRQFAIVVECIAGSIGSALLALF